MGIVRGPIFSPKLITKVWFEDKYALFYNDKIEGGLSKPKLAYFSEHPFISFNKAYAPQYFRDVLAICTQSGFVPKIQHECNNVGSIIQLVRNGFGQTILPVSVAKNYNFKEIAFLQFELKTKVLLVYPTEFSNPITYSAIQYLEENEL